MYRFDELFAFIGTFVREYRVWITHARLDSSPTTFFNVTLRIGVVVKSILERLLLVLRGLGYICADGEKR
jgi:hypothetical protein